MRKPTPKDQAPPQNKLSEINVDKPSEVTPPEVASSTIGSLVQPKEAMDFLWRVVGRFDFYIGTVNAKAAFLIAFNTFTFSALVLKWGELTKIPDLPRVTVGFTLVFLAVAAVAALVSLAFTFAAINPFLKTPPTSISRIFFGNVARYGTHLEYLEQITGSTGTELLEDLAGQAHFLAKGTAAKFTCLRWAVGWIVVELCAIVLIVITHLVTGLCVVFQ